MLIFRRHWAIVFCAACLQANLALSQTSPHSVPQSPGLAPATPAAVSGWPNNCGDGRIDRIIDDFEDPLLWTFCCSDTPQVARPTLQKVAGCAQNSLAIGFDLAGGNWIVVTRRFDEPLDLSRYTHLRVAMRGSTLAAHHNLEVKLFDGKGLYTSFLKSIVDLPVWRPIYIDFREFTCGDCLNQPVDLSRISRVEIAISRCVADCEVSPDQPVTSTDRGVFYLDELGAVDLRPGARNRLVQKQFETVSTAAKDVRSTAARAIRDRQEPDGLIPAWFDEENPNYNTYTLAVALIVFVEEYERTRDAGYKDAADRAARILLNAQIKPGKRNAGAWFTAYQRSSSGLVSSDSFCSGNENVTSDIDRCSWIGNTAWAVIALARLKSSDIFSDSTGLNASIGGGSSWMAGQIGRITTHPELVTLGMEGNISTFFGLLAAGKTSEAERMAIGIYKYGWDSTLKRMKIGAASGDFATAMDTAGSWGVQFLRKIRREEDALLSAGYAATILRVNSFDQSTEGYGDIAGPFTVTVEFGAQAAAAGILDANRVMEQIYTLQAGDGSFPGSSDHWYGGQVPPWSTKWRGIAPGAWVYFAQNGDPLSKLTGAINFVVPKTRRRP